MAAVLASNDAPALHGGAVCCKPFHRSLLRWLSSSLKHPVLLLPLLSLAQPVDSNNIHLDTQTDSLAEDNPAADILVEDNPAEDNPAGDKVAVGDNG